MAIFWGNSPQRPTLGALLAIVLIWLLFCLYAVYCQPFTKPASGNARAGALPVHVITVRKH